MAYLQTVGDFVTKPITGIRLIDETPCPIPDYMVTGIDEPVAQLAFAPTIAEVTQIPTPWRFLWRRPATRMVR